MAGTDLAIGVAVSTDGIAPYTDGNTGYFQGVMDDVMIFDRALTASEIGQLRNNQCSAQNLLLNRGFEAPSIETNTIQQITPTSWAWSADVGDLHNGQATAEWPLPHGGLQYVSIGNEPTSTSLLQSFTTRAVSTYVLSWWDSSGHSDGFATSPYTVGILNAVGETVIEGTFDAYHADFGAWEQRFLQFALVPGDYTLRFHAEGVPNGLHSLIDDVSLIPTPTGKLDQAIIAP
ncbi:hypothetical protein [uncultured Lamprocystis sp.]|uniref:hypothetical protein n=1 Tax=uncultured Lamprocystis sp. TaxID=543132 RepID=UPI0025F597E8|nr:hypothetical protein [uncultured Lamprocystis sp.]